MEHLTGRESVERGEGTAVKESTDGEQPGHFAVPRKDPKDPFPRRSTL